MLDLGRTFLQSVERSPQAIALVDGALRLSYADWALRVGAVQRGLAAAGLKRGDHLLVVLQNRWEMATLHWACQFAGIVMTPLNWRAKPEEIDYCLADAEAKAIVWEPVADAAVAASSAASRALRIGVGEVHGATLHFEDWMTVLDEPVPHAEFAGDEVEGRFTGQGHCFGAAAVVVFDVQH